MNPVSPRPLDYDNYFLNIQVHDLVSIYILDLESESWPCFNSPLALNHFAFAPVVI